MTPSRRPVIVLDALAARFGGTAYAAIQVARVLEERDEVERVVVIAQRGSIVETGLRHSDKLNMVPLNAPGGRSELIWRLAWETAQLPRLVKQHRADALVSFSGMVPRAVACTTIAIVANPVPFTERGTAGNIARRVAIRRTLARSIGYVPSTGMRDLVGAADLKIVPLGVDHGTFRPGTRAGMDLLCVADFYAHKNHRLLIDAWERLPEPRPRLRLIGNPAVDPSTFAAVSAAARDPRISVEGRVGFETLLAAYAGARALVLPSEHESFAMPLAEGLACGVPSVIADHPVMRETAGPGALVVSEATAAAWAIALERAVRDDALHATLRANGMAYAQRYSWAAMASEIVSDAVST